VLDDLMSRRVQATALVEAVINRITDGYIFPDRSARAASLLRARCEAGAYDLPAGLDLCERLSADLFEACADKHLRLLWHESAEASRDEAGLEAELLEQFRRENYGMRRVEQLPGNIGVIELTIIPPASPAGPTIAAAIQLMHHTDALILDLREARGGAPDGVAFLCSFFFSDGDVHLNDIIEGPNGPTRQVWTYSYVPGPRYLDRPIYVLTSASTFSGAEEVAYDLKALGRATIVGETTRGGAHPSEVVSLGEHIELRLPVARSVNPVTGTNWEAIGVQPDVPVPAANALIVAHRAALETLADENARPMERRADARRLLDQLEHPLNAQPS
jgi:C-terminal processing protease CtpA/Prc